MINWLKKKLHIHSWETTHANKWIHPTRQICNCSLVREFEYFSNKDELKGMPWNLGRWVWSNGEESKYGVND